MKLSRKFFSSHSTYYLDHYKSKNMSKKKRLASCAPHTKMPFLSTGISLLQHDPIHNVFFLMSFAAPFSSGVSFFMGTFVCFFIFEYLEIRPLSECINLYYVMHCLAYILFAAFQCFTHVKFHSRVGTLIMIQGWVGGCSCARSFA